MRTRTLAPIVGAFIAGSLITWAAVSHDPPASVSSSAPITRPLVDWPPVTVTVPTTVTASPVTYTVPPVTFTESVPTTVDVTVTGEAVTVTADPETVTADPETVTRTVRPDTVTATVNDELHWTDGVAVCLEEDGSTPGQEFPCRWEAASLGNGQGEDFTLTGPDTGQ
jgi:hypothetical protein